MEEPDFWLDPEKSTKIVQEMKSLKNSVENKASMEIGWDAGGKGKEGPAI